jgi:glycine/D-amino acid oxidase-like deaminating enzyme
MNDIFHSAFKSTPFWWEAAPPTDEGSAPLPAHTDVAIIGSGYTGLNCALELARRGIGATVIEAERFGEGASTRNGGHVSGGVNLGKPPAGTRESPLIARLGRARYEALLREAAEAFERLEMVIARESIDCHFMKSGRFVAACTRAQYRDLERKAGSLDPSGKAAIRVLPAERQHEEIVSPFYRGGMVVDGAAQLHPSLYHRGLLDACRRQGVTLCAHTRVHQVQRKGPGFRLSTSAGEITADAVLRATNGYTGAESAWLRRRLIPLGSYIIVTEDIGAERARALIPNLRTINDSKRVLSYFRIAPGGTRVMFGGREAFSPVTAQQSARLLHRTMLRVFPQLAGVRVTHSWTGNVAFTFDYMPHVGQQDGAYYAAGCNGSGVVMMSYLGYRAALLIARANQTSAFDGIDMPTLPGYTGTPWFTPILGRYYRFRDALDRWLD